MDDVTVRGIAEMDQAEAACKSLATILAGYFAHLIDQGFTQPEAMEIVLSYQDWLLSQTGRSAP